MSFINLFKSIFHTDDTENAHSIDVVETFADHDQGPIGINPCSGLSMIDSSSTIDVGGNVYGTCSNDFESSFIDNTSSIDDSYDCDNSFDDSFSDDSWNDF